MSWLPAQRQMTKEELIASVNAGLGDGLGGLGASAPLSVGAASSLSGQPSPIPGANEAGGVLLGNTYGSALGAAPTPVLDAGQPAGGPAGVNLADAAAAVRAHPAFAPSEQGAAVDEAIRNEERRRLSASRSGQATAEAKRDGYLAAADAAGADAGAAGLQVAEAEAKTDAAKAGVLDNAAEQQQRDMQEFRADRAVMMSQAAAAQRKADYLADQAANAEMKNFWADKSTGSRIMGIIAQTLSGAANGLAGQPGAPSALDRIIDRDFELQKRNLAHKTESAQAAAGALGQIYNSFSNKQQAFSAMQQAMGVKVKQEIEAMSAHFTSDTAVARKAEAIRRVDETIAQKNAEVAQHEVAGKSADGNAAADNLVDMRRQDIQANQFSQSDLRNYREIPGLSGVYRKDALTESGKKKMVAYGESLSALEQMRTTVNDPASFANLVQGGALESMMRGGARERLGVGANVQGKEAADMEAIIQQFLKGKAIHEVSPQTFNDMIDALERVAGTGARGVLGASVPNAEYDETHPIFGRALALSRPKAAPPLPAK